MLLGLSLTTFTALHVVISLIGIAAGLVWLVSAVGGRWRSGWNSLFLITTIATSVTGFMFPADKFGPAHIIGVISLVLLAVALLAIGRGPARGAGATVYRVTAAIALYLNSFVGVVQAFQKIAPLNALAPTGSEPPFAVAQGLVLLAFLVLGFLLVRRRMSAI